MWINEWHIWNRSSRSLQPCCGYKVILWVNYDNERLNLSFWLFAKSLGTETWPSLFILLQFLVFKCHKIAEEFCQWTVYCKNTNFAISKIQVAAARENNPQAPSHTKGRRTIALINKIGIGISEEITKIPLSQLSVFSHHLSINPP